ncbi:hypothetical protein GLE_4215 [Lysobacter enzymogenes]|uniref:Uncharacterized protein n=1 Tax=Lysobacter enzymogenes TaxID=69 RepID=A0A0S2DM58_LYSEN|nr:hypothetical protein GLE_4215 [Lysobacter enzymogenes]
MRPLRGRAGAPAVAPRSSGSWKRCKKSSACWAGTVSSRRGSCAARTVLCS